MAQQQSLNFVYLASILCISLFILFFLILEHNENSNYYNLVFPELSGICRLMAQEQEGWPLGLRPLNSRVGLVRNRDNSGSISFGTLLTGSPTSSSASSSDLDTESAESFFNDKSITLGSLIGISSILEISRRASTRANTAETNRNKTIFKAKPWLFSICSNLSTDAVNNMNPTTTPSLGHFLRQERRSTITSICRTRY